MAKALVQIKVMDDNGDIQEWQGTYDLDTSTANTKGLVERLRILLRREFIRRSLMVSTPEDRTK